MAVLPGPANAIVYAQFILQGRWRRMLLIAGSYGALMGSIIWLSMRDRSHLSARDLSGFVAMLGVLQMANLLVLGTYRVEAAVRGDVTSRMLESHRLMPAGPLGGILGYLFGAPLQSYIVGIVNFALGAICCMVGGMPVDSWALFNAALLFFAIFVHSIILQLSFVTWGGFLLLFICGLLLMPASAAGGLDIIPSLNVLLFPLVSRESVFKQIFGGGPNFGSPSILLGYGGAVAGQAIITLLAIRVAMRRYLSSSMVGISPLLGLLLLATWAALALVGFDLPHRHYFSPSYDYDEERFVPQVVCSFATALLLAIFPIASAARESQRRWHTESATSRTGTRFSVLWTVLAASAIFGGLLFGISFVHSLGYNATARIAVTGVIVVNFLVAMACFFAQGYARGRRPWIMVLFWVPLTWIGPPVVDLIYRQIINNYDSATGLTAFSVPGALALLWSNSSVSIQAGIAGQVLLTVVPAGLLLMARRKAGAVSGNNIQEKAVRFK